MSVFVRRMWCVLAVLVLALPSARAEDFRIATKIYQDKGKEPVAENLTLFSSGVVYDFLLTAPQEIAIFDTQRERFILLDTTKRKKTTILADDVLRFTTLMKARAAKSRNKLVRFMGSPEFEENYDVRRRTLTLDHSLMTYRVESEKAPSESAAREYRHFADWYVRLNATRPGGKPPFARLEVNRALFERQLIPGSVELTIPARSWALGKTVKIRAEHAVSWQLLPADRRRIDLADEYLAKFKDVGFEDFRGLAKR